MEHVTLILLRHYFLCLKRQRCHVNRHQMSIRQDTTLTQNISFVWEVKCNRATYIRIAPGVEWSINSLCPSHAIYCHRSGLSLPLLTVCYMRALNHYVNQCQLSLGALWYSYDSNFTDDEFNLRSKITLLELPPHLPGISFDNLTNAKMWNVFGCFLYITVCIYHFIPVLL